MWAYYDFVVVRTQDTRVVRLAVLPADPVLVLAGLT